MRNMLGGLVLLLTFVTWSGEALAVVELVLAASPHSTEIAPLSSNKNTFTTAIHGSNYGTAFTKHFKIRVKKGGSVVFECPTQGAHTTDSTTIYSCTKEPALTWGMHQIEAQVSVYRKSDNSQVYSQTTTMDYDVPKAYGWFTAVTRGNAPGINVTTKLTSGNTTAEDAIAGNTLGSIMRDADTKVRGTNDACQQCHGPGKIRPQWDAATMQKDEFCNNRVSTFNGSGSKPQVLKNLFNTWKLRGCPD